MSNKKSKTKTQGKAQYIPQKKSRIEGSLEPELAKKIGIYGTIICIVASVICYIALGCTFDINPGGVRNVGREALFMVIFTAVLVICTFIIMQIFYYRKKSQASKKKELIPTGIIADNKNAASGVSEAFEVSETADQIVVTPEKDSKE